MNGAAAPGAWQESKDATGRTYYWHTGTKQTQWEKPAELAQQQTSASSAAAWKEYTADGGRKYWHNSETKETTWNEPEALRNAQQQQQPQQHQPQQPAYPRQAAGPEFVAGGSGAHAAHHNDRYNDRHNDRQVEHYRERGQGDRRPDFSRHDLGLGFVAAAANANEVNFSSLEEAEAAFIKLLRRSGVKPDWTWEQAMRATIKDPQYRGIKDPTDRRTAFDKFVQEARQQDKEREKERLAKLREDFRSMLKSHPEIQHYSRWKTARPMIEGETIFRSSGNETEKRQLFEEYIIELRKQHAEQEGKTRKAALDDMAEVLASLDLEPYTRWQDAQSMLDGHDRFRNDAKFQALSKPDVLTAFDNHIKSLERFFNDHKQLEKSRKARRERQHRDDFAKLLRELHRAGKIKAGTKWLDFRPLVEADARYDAMLGQDGSSPLELFWDVVEEEEIVLRRKRNEAADVLVDVGLELRDQSDRDAFVQAMRRDRRTSNLDDYEVKLIFDRLLEKSNRLMAQDRDDQERRHRRAIDALRSKIKHLEPPVRLGDSWDDVRARIEASDEYLQLPTDELRRSAYDKVMRRLDEKDEYERRGGGRRDRERDSHRPNGRSSYRGEAASGQARESDPYEADRRKAQEDREKSYRRSGTGLSPPPRGSRGDRDRDRYDDRPSRRHERTSSYDRSRRERDLERERLYSSRADPRDSTVRALDYDEGGTTSTTTANMGRAGSTVSERSGGAASTRRRRDSPDHDMAGGERRDSKRARRDTRGRAGSRTPMDVDSSARDSSGGGAAAAAMHDRKRLDDADKEEENLKSGSEEGEIEED